MPRRFEDCFDRGAPDECWPWKGCLQKGGYGKFGRGSRLPHRIMYEREHGPIPPGFTVDHTCHNEAAARGECSGGRDCPHRRCVNPDHLEAVTMRENLRRSPNVPSTINALKKNCGKAGHEYATHRRGSKGERVCLGCDAEKQRKYQERKRAASCA